MKVVVAASFAVALAAVPVAPLIAHHSFAAEFAADVPYVLVVVDLGAGVRAMGRLRPPANPALGLPVRIGFEPDAAGDPRPVFTATT